MPEEKDFERSVKQIVTRVLRHEVTSIREARALLQRLHTEILAEIAQGGAEFNQMVLRQLERAIQERVDEFTRDLDRMFKAQLNKSIDLGKEMADEPLKVAGLRSSVIGVSSQTAQVAAGYSAGLISGISPDLMSKIDSILSAPALGGVSPQDAITQIGRKFNTRTIDGGPFKSAFARAETIVRTEVLRIQSIATHARLLQQRESMKSAGYDLKKRWFSSHDFRVRSSHFAAEAQGAIPLEDPFIVGGEELQYPRDPAGSAEETINCRCVEAPAIERLFVLDRSKKFER